jgi:hypothetical protein
VRGGGESTKADGTCARGSESRVESVSNSDAARVLKKRDAVEEGVCSRRVVGFGE